MKRIAALVFACVLCSTLYVTRAFAEVVINEFLIEPTPQVVELLNKSTETIDISNWYIDDNGGTTYFTIPEDTVLYPNACMSFTASFNFNRTSADTVRLFDSTAPPVSSSAVLVDSFSYKSSSGSGITFQRMPDGEDIWATGTATVNLFNLTGNSCLVLPPATPSPTLTPLPIDSPTPTPTPIVALSTPTPTTVPIPTPTIGYIYLSEVYPYPESGENEWVELYNDNEFPVTLKNWKIDDVANGGSSPKSFSLVIGGYSFASFDISSSMFNNDGDDVRLFDENNTLHGSFTYETAEQGNSIGRMDFLTDIYCIQPPSRSLVNNACLSDHMITMTPIPTKKPSPTPTKYPKASLPKRNILITPTTYIPQIRNTVSAVYSKASSEGGTVLGEDTAADTEGGSVEVLDLQDEQYRDMAQFFSISSAVSSFLTLAVVFIKMML